MIFFLPLNDKINIADRLQSYFRFDEYNSRRSSRHRTSDISILKDISIPADLSVRSPPPFVASYCPSAYIQEQGSLHRLTESAKFFMHCLIVCASMLAARLDTQNRLGRRGEKCSGNNLRCSTKYDGKADIYFDIGWSGRGKIVILIAKVFISVSAVWSRHYFAILYAYTYLAGVPV